MKSMLKNVDIMREKDNILNPCIFIVGCSRSGTTLLKRLIDAHPDVAFPMESHWITKFFEKPGILTPEGFVTPQLIRKLRKHRKFQKLKLGQDDIESLLPSEGSLRYQEFVSGIYDLYGQRKGKKLVGDKTPPYARHIPLLHSLWPKSKFIHIIRDGRDVGLSVLNWKRARVTAGRIGSWSDDRVTTVALWWEWYVRLGREGGQSIGPELYHEVRYESLIQETENECRRVCDFLDLTFDEAMLSYHKGRVRTAPELDAKAAWLPPTRGLRDWRSDMAAGDLERFESAAGGLLDELGYQRGIGKLGSDAIAYAEQMRKRFDGHPLPETW
jgi:hypothetical protein